jgi:DNA-binding Xre family transcriptional regulator
MIENTNKKELEKIGKILNKKDIKKSSARNKYYISTTINKENQNKILKLMKDNKRFKIQSHFNIELSDGHKSNVEAFNKWIYKEFKINPISFYERKNSWRTIFSNKILARYLMCFFDFNPSYKSRNVKEPKIIKKSDLKIRKEFAKGVLMFDGCITKGKKIMFSTKSPYLAESIKDILNKDNLKIGFFKNKREEYTVYTTSKNNSNRLLDYFEKGTKKWDLLKWLIHKNFESEKIDYSKEIKFAKDILNLLKKIKSADSNYLMRKFNCSHTTIREKLKILNNKRIIRLTKHPKNISNYISKETTVFLKKKFHDDLFYQILKKFNSYGEFSRFLGIHKATLSAWKIKKNKIPLKIIKSICESLEIPFDITLKNVYETDREIAEVT